MPDVPPAQTLSLTETLPMYGTWWAIPLLVRSVRALGIGDWDHGRGEWDRVRYNRRLGEQEGTGSVRLVPLSRCVKNVGYFLVEVVKGSFIRVNTIHAPVTSALHNQLLLSINSEQSGGTYL